MSQKFSFGGPMQGEALEEDSDDIDNQLMQQVASLPPFKRKIEKREEAKVVGARVPLDIHRMINRFVVEHIRGYDNVSDFVRDAVVRWAIYIHEETGRDDRFVDSIITSESIMSRRVFTEGRRIGMVKIVNEMELNVQSAMSSCEYEHAVDELTEYVDQILAVSDAYWRNQYLKRLQDSKSVRDLLRLVERNTPAKYKAIVSKMALLPIT